MDPAAELLEIGLNDVPLVGLQMKYRVILDIDIALGGPYLLRVVQVHERIGDEHEVGIEVFRILHMGYGRSHLPDYQVPRTGGEGFSYSVKTHFSASAENMAVIVFLIGIRILTVLQGVEYQKIFHNCEVTEDSLDYQFSRFNT